MRRINRSERENIPFESGRYLHIPLRNPPIRNPCGRRSNPASGGPGRENHGNPGVQDKTVERRLQPDFGGIFWKAECTRRSGLWAADATVANSIHVRFPISSFQLLIMSSTPNRAGGSFSGCRFLRLSGRAALLRAQEFRQSGSSALQQGEEFCRAPSFSLRSFSTCRAAGKRIFAPSPEKQTKHKMGGKEKASGRKSKPSHPAGLSKKRF